MHTLSDLFEQLGLDPSINGIAQFVTDKGPIAAGVVLHKASFWTPTQASFLAEAVEQDADWAELVDQLDNMLR
ncbi:MULTISPECIES: DUF2789 family protein [unclassified Agarivorans]|nr:MULTISPECIES: DUF2789 family protein [unclassified Agarivorans]MDO6687829.1 DUF2789 family protein [Agarivorans sp. 3_MG-2023]MDO6717451.1 DUF2789 family protein [Agarivorans sp. 2_MG-2023]MDO6763175.1 DUF2789 family protein [Agarivorans sp. 1_MG-2023]